MPTTYAIPNGRTVMDATTYSGNGSTQTITNNDLGTVGFKPDLVWIKIRGNVADHRLTDSVRGVTKEIYSNTTAAEETDTNGLTAFNTNGFNVGSTGAYNLNGGSLVAWQWQAGQGTTSSNTSGSITSTVSVNATAGFSIVTYTGNGSTSTVGHGLGVAPSMIIIKGRSTTFDWRVWHTSLAATYDIQLNTTAAAAAAATVYPSAPTSSVINIGSGTAVNTNGGTFVAYCWTPIAGFSQFGSYTGNGSTDGPFVYLGFRPKFILIKNINDGGAYWNITDSVRGSYNVDSASLYPNVSDAEGTSGVGFDFLSNGFKVRNAATFLNTSGHTMIYMAFAENPLKFANAR